MNTAKRKRVIIYFCILFVCTLCLAFGFGCNKDDSGKQYNISVEISGDNISKSVGEDFIVPYATLLDSNDDRVDDIGVKVVWGTKASTVKREVEQGKTVRCLQIGEWQLVYSAENSGDVIITVKACKKLDSPENLHVDGNTLSWKEVEDASGYVVTFYGEEGIKTESNTYESDRFAGAGWFVYVSAVGANDEYIKSEKSQLFKKRQAPLDYVALFDNPASQSDVVGTKFYNDPEGENGFLDFTNLLKQVSYETDGEEKFVRIRTLSNPNNGMFGINLDNIIKDEDKYLDFEGKSGGIEIKFRLNKSTVSEELYFQLANHSDGSRLGCYDKEILSGYGTKIENGKWQTLSLSFDLFNERYDETDKIINLNIRGTDLPANSVFELDLQYIKYYYTFPSPQNLKFSSDFSTLSWEEVAGAEGYLVEIGEKSIEVPQSIKSIDFSEYKNSDVIVKVSAVTSSTRYAYSLKNTIVYHKLSDNEIAKMDSVTYEQDFCGAKWREADFSISLCGKQYSEENDTKFIRLNLNTNGNNAPFAFSVLKNLDLETYAGIEVRCRLKKGIGSDLYFQPCRNSKGARDGATEVDSVYGTLLTEGSWQNIKIPIEIFRSYYPETDTAEGTKLQFNLRSLIDITDRDYFEVEFDIAYVRYYEALGTPQIELVNKTVQWEAVVGADGYTINVNGTDYVTEELSYDLTSIMDAATGDVYVKVKATDSRKQYVDSPYSEMKGKKVLAAGEIANFNSALYETDFADNTANGDFMTGGGTIPWTSAPIAEYVENEGNGGAVKVSLAESAKSTVNALFINLENKLDLVNNKGIKLRFKITDNEAYTNLYLQFADATCLNGGSWNLNADAMQVNEGEWQTLTISKEKLISGDYGYTANSKQLALVLRRDSGGYIGATCITLDYIEYYND